MAQLPTKIRSWKFRVNESISAGASAAATNQILMLAIKNAILGGGSWTDEEGDATAAPTGWTVAGSSDASTSNMAGTDLWTDASKLVAASGATAKSWIVLRHATLGDLLFYLTPGAVSNQQADISWSKTGFGAAFGGSDGSINATPTSVDTVALSTGAYGGPNATASSRLHVLQAPDALHIAICRNGWPTALVHLTTVDASVLDVGNWPVQIVGRWSGVITAAPSGATSIAADVPSTAFVGRGASANLSFSPMTWGRAAGATALFADAAHGKTGDLPILPIGLYCTTTSNEGIYAFVPDVWLTTNGARNFGFPDDSAAEWQGFANTILPWNKSTALLS